MKQVGPIYNPIIKKGKYRVTLGDKSAIVIAGDAAEAKWKFARKFGFELNAIVAETGVEVLSKTIRKFDSLESN